MAKAGRGKIYDSILDTIADTPLVRLPGITKSAKGDLLYKLEFFNPGASVKDRIALAMIEDLENAGKLKKGGTTVEPTSGNTGIGLALVAAAKGYKAILTMPESMSIERRKLITLLGAEIVLTPAAGGMPGAIAKADELAKVIDGAVQAGQFVNPANPAIHFKTTGPEIWNDTDGKVDILISGVGTGGTISGCARYLKSQKSTIEAVAVEPADSAIIAQKIAGEELTPGPHKIQGIGANFIPGNLDISLLDRVEPVSNDDSMAMAHRLMSEEGILAGISCGAAMIGALRLAEDPAYADKTIVVVLPDSGERYLTSPLFEGFFNH